MPPLRERLVAARPSAAAYARTLARMPADLVGAQARVDEIAIYPVKGLGGLRLAHARVDARGLVDPATGLADRGAMLAFRHPGADAEGPYDAIALSNRLDGTTSLARASLDDGALRLEAPGVEPLRLAPADLAPRDGQPVRVKLYEGGPVVEGVAEDGPLTRWGRALVAAHPARRRFRPEDVVAVVPAAGRVRSVAQKHRAGEESAQTLFGDGGHLLVASRTTLAWMNEELRARGHARPIAMEAFRPNVVLDGLPPNAEDLVREVEVAGARLVFATACVRCDATRTDVATGRKPDREPLAFLARERPPRDGEPASATFAVNAVFPASAYGRSIRIGDAARVTAERA